MKYTSIAQALKNNRRRLYGNIKPLNRVFSVKSIPEWILTFCKQYNIELVIGG